MGKYIFFNFSSFPFYEGPLFGTLPILLAFLHLPMQTIWESHMSSSWKFGRKKWIPSYPLCKVIWGNIIKWALWTYHYTKVPFWYFEENVNLFLILDVFFELYIDFATRCIPNTKNYLYYWNQNKNKAENKFSSLQ